MDRWINPHRNLESVFAGDLLVNFKKVAVTFANRLFTEPFNGVRKIEIDATSTRSNTAPFVTHFLRCARSDIAWRQIAEARILALKIVITVRFRDLVWRFGTILFSFRYPDAAVIAQRLGHQG